MPFGKMQTLTSFNEERNANKYDIEYDLQPNTTKLTLQKN